MSNNNPTPSITKAQLQTERIKHWTGVITITITGLVTLITAVSAHLKPEKEETAKAAYNELSKAVKQLSDEQIKLHNDISNIRGYLYGLREESRLVSLPPSPLRPPPAVRRSAKKIEQIEAFEGEYVEELPQISDRPDTYQLPPVDSLK